MLDPIELLEERLHEIDLVKSNEKEYKRYRMKYVVSIWLLRLNGFEKRPDNRFKLTRGDIKWLQDNCKKGERDYYADLFKVHPTTIDNYLKKVV